MTPPKVLMHIDHVSKTFSKTLDYAEKLSNTFFRTNIKPWSLHAVNQVSLAIYEGEVLGLVGESGCGKSTLGQVLAGISDHTAGDIKFHGVSLKNMSANERKQYRLSTQMIFQDPMSSLNPRQKVMDMMTEAPLAHGLIRTSQAHDYAIKLMHMVGLDPSYLQRYPHQFSGGQRQRIGIARALGVNPKFLICDESIAALDVSVQAQIINLFMALKKQLGLTYVFISHDLGVVKHISDRVAIMYLGQIVEITTTERLFNHAQHPYTLALLAEMPDIRHRKRHFTPIKGEIPSALNPPSGCHFHPRCPFATALCSKNTPPLQAISDSLPEHQIACHHPQT